MSIGATSPSLACVSGSCMMKQEMPHKKELSWQDNVNSSKFNISASFFA